jgi:hypothetical protein
MKNFCNVLKVSQGCGSGSVFQLLDPDPRSKYGSGYDTQKLHKKINKNTELLCFEVLHVLFKGLMSSFVAKASFLEA